MRKLLLAGLIMVLAPGVAYAGGGGVDTSACAGYSEGSTLSMQDSCFAGTAHFAPSGASISIENVGALPHNLTAVDGSFQTGNVEPGGTAGLTVDEPGIYQFFCTLHGTAEGEGMAGVLVVGEPEPGTVAASLDTTAFVEAVADENQGLVEAMDRQGRAMGDIRAAQRDVAEALEDLTAAGAIDSSDMPSVVPVPVESDTVGIALAITAGVAAGLAIAALVTVLWLRRREPGATGLERLEPSTES